VKEKGVSGGMDSNYRLLVHLKEEKFGEVLEKLRKLEDLLIEISCRLSALEIRNKKWKGVRWEWKRNELI